MYKYRIECSDWDTEETHSCILEHEELYTEIQLSAIVRQVIDNMYCVVYNEKRAILANVFGSKCTEEKISKEIRVMDFFMPDSDRDNVWNYLVRKRGFRYQEQPTASIHMTGSSVVTIPVLESEVT
jgi:hypothetical protein